MQETTYGVTLICTNCGYKKGANITLGTTIKEHCKTKCCPNCGCVGVLVIDNSNVLPRYNNKQY